MNDTTQINETMPVSQCEHCGLETPGVVKGECARCSRTFHFVRHVRTPESVRAEESKIRQSRIARNEKAKRDRQQVAWTIRKLFKTGWYGCQIIPADKRRSLAKRLVECHHTGQVPSVYGLASD